MLASKRSDFCLSEPFRDPDIIPALSHTFPTHASFLGVNFPAAATATATATNRELDEAPVSKVMRWREVSREERELQRS
jgi:hypothetical protein